MFSRIQKYGNNFKRLIFVPCYSISGGNKIWPTLVLSVVKLFTSFKLLRIDDIVFYPCSKFYQNQLIDLKVKDLLTLFW